MRFTLLVQLSWVGKHLQERERQTNSIQCYSTAVRQAGERKTGSMPQKDLHYITYHLSQSRNHLPQGSQRFVDVCTLL